MAHKGPLNCSSGDHVKAYIRNLVHICIISRMFITSVYIL